MTNRFILAPIAFAISAAFIAAAATPAMAAETGICATAPGQIRTVATTAQPDQARKALTLVNVGEKLCEAGARNEAGKKFSAAAKALGTDMAALTSAAPTRNSTPGSALPGRVGRCRLRSTRCRLLRAQRCCCRAAN